MERASQTKIILEYPDLDENAIDAAIDATYLTSANNEEWERQARLMLGLNPYWRSDQEELPAKRAKA